MRGEHRGYLDFVVVGAQKAGTTTLHSWLTGQSDLALPSRKETHFFSSEGRWQRGWDWYRSSFPAVLARGTLRGEVDPDYLSNVGTAELIRDEIGDIPVVVVLRDPVDRLISQYRMSRSRGLEDRALRPALLDELAQWRSGRTVDDHRNYIWRSLYGRHISHYERVFSRVHLVPFHVLTSSTPSGEAAYREVLRFIGAEDVPYGRDVAVRSNEASAAKSQALNALIWRRQEMPVLRRVVRASLPSRRLRYRLGKAVDMWNRRPANSPGASSAMRGQVPDDVLDVLATDLSVDCPPRLREFAEPWLRRIAAEGQ